MHWTNEEYAAYQARQTPPVHDLPEARWLAEVLTMARRGGYLAMHIHDSRKSAGVGFPDVVLVRPEPEPGRGVVVMAELKTQRGKCTMAQLTWLAALHGKTIEAGIYRPSDRETLWALLSARRT